jgi:hypothetical protein
MGGPLCRAAFDTRAFVKSDWRISRARDSDGGGAFVKTALRRLQKQGQNAVFGQNSDLFLPNNGEKCRKCFALSLPI